jgi:hypothetical protein
MGERRDDPPSDESEAQATQTITAGGGSPADAAGDSIQKEGPGRVRALAARAAHVLLSPARRLLRLVRREDPATAERSQPGEMGVDSQEGPYRKGRRRTVRQFAPRDLFKTDDPRLDSIAAIYFFLISDAYREYREASVRWECFAASQYHFDDGVKLVLESGDDYPVEHPVWSQYSEKVAEIAARVARLEDRKRERLAALKGVHAGFLRFCKARQISAERITSLVLSDPDRLDALETPGVQPAGEIADETYSALDDEWNRSTAEAEAGSEAAG